MATTIYDYDDDFDWQKCNCADAALRAACRADSHVLTLAKMLRLPPATRPVSQVPQCIYTHAYYQPLHVPRSSRLPPMPLMMASSAPHRAILTWRTYARSFSMRRRRAMKTSAHSSQRRLRLLGLFSSPSTGRGLIASRPRGVGARPLACRWGGGVGWGRRQRACGGRALDNEQRGSFVFACVARGMGCVSRLRIAPGESGESRSRPGLDSRHTVVAGQCCGARTSFVWLVYISTILSC